MTAPNSGGIAMLFGAKNRDPLADLAARLTAAGSHHAAAAVSGAVAGRALVEADPELGAAVDAVVAGGWS